MNGEHNCDNAKKECALKHHRVSVSVALLSVCAMSVAAPSETMIVPGRDS